MSSVRLFEAIDAARLAVESIAREYSDAVHPDLRDALRALDDARAAEVVARCPACQARGVVPCPGYAGRDCRICHGRGYLDAEEMAFVLSPNGAHWLARETERNGPPL